MLTRTTIEYLRRRSFDPSAERWTSYLPLGGNYWSDEIPDFKALAALSDGASDEVFRLMGIRLQIWNGEVLSDEDQAFWNAATAQAPDCPVFQRLTISEDDREAQLAAERSMLEFVEALADGADEFEIDQEGRLSATFDLSKEDRQPAWKRLSKNIYENIFFL